MWKVGGIVAISRRFFKILQLYKSLKNNDLSAILGQSFLNYLCKSVLLYPWISSLAKNRVKFVRFLDFLVLIGTLDSRIPKNRTF